MGLCTLIWRVFLLIILASFIADIPGLLAAAEAPHDAVLTKIAAVTPGEGQAGVSNTSASDDAGASTSPQRYGIPPESRFRELDMETESVLKEALNLSSDIAIIDERENNPAKFQLFVLVSMEPTNIFELDLVELQIDKQVVAAHQYDNMDISAMSRGGGHQLYIANLPAGMHELTAKMTGKIPRDPDYHRETSFNFISGVQRTIIELRVTGEKSKGFPDLVAKEWN